MKRSLTRKERLSGKREIEELFKKAERVEGGGLKLLFRANGREYSRVFITTKRGFKTAVGRNRQKRILREVYRNFKSSIKQGFDLGFILVNEESSFNEMRENFFNLLDRARLRSDESGRQ